MNRLKTSTSRVVTGFDVNILVGSCLIGMLSSVFGLRNTQQMNASLNKVISSSHNLLFSFFLFGCFANFYVKSIFFVRKFIRMRKNTSERMKKREEGKNVITIFAGRSKAHGIMCKYFDAHEWCSKNFDHVRINHVRVHLFDAG